MPIMLKEKRKGPRHEMGSAGSCSADSDSASGAPTRSRNIIGGHSQQFLIPRQRPIVIACASVVRATIGLVVDCWVV